MPIDQHRRHEIATAVVAYDAANPKARLPRNAVLLLATMFPAGEVCRRSLQDIANDGFSRKALPGVLKRLVEAGFLSRQPGSGIVSSTWYLHLPPLVRP